MVKTKLKEILLILRRYNFWNSCRIRANDNIYKCASVSYVTVAGLIAVENSVQDGMYHTVCVLLGALNPTILSKLILNAATLWPSTDGAATVFAVEASGLSQSRSANGVMLETRLESTTVSIL